VTHFFPRCFPDEALAQLPSSTIKVDVLTGIVLYEGQNVNPITRVISGEGQQLFYPDPALVVKLRLIKVNLLHFGYEVVVRSDNIVRTHPIVGGPEGKEALSMSTIESFTEKDGDLEKIIAELQGQVNEIDRDLQDFFIHDAARDEYRWATKFGEKGPSILGQVPDLQHKVRSLPDVDEAGKKKKENLHVILSEIEKTITRWNVIIHGTKPETIQEVLLPQEAKRYHIQIRRYATSAYARTASYDPTKPDTATVATISFETRTRSRINFALGVAGSYQPQFSYGFVGSPGSSGEVGYRVTEIERTTWSTDYVATIGVYFGAVDDVLDKFWDWDRCMIIFGSHIATSPRFFVVGLAYDLPFGLVLGFGLTPYTRTSLASGWSEGQVVPESTKTAVGSVPTTKKTEAGYFASLEFRPKIFQAFVDLFKED
jgi:hypothetical protein